MKPELQKVMNASFQVMKSIHQRSYQKQDETNNLYPGQHKFLAIIMKNEGLTQKELAEKQFVKPATVTGMLNKLESNQIIYRVPDETDKRIMRVYLTQKGRLLAESGEKYMIELTQTMFEGFTTEELNTYLALTLKIRDNLQNETKKH